MAAEQISSPPLSEAFPDEESTNGNGVNGAADEDDDEDDVQTGSRRQKPVNGGGAEVELDDLFGDEEDEAQPA
jgi:RNA polymerase-associated protein LEO1